MKILQGTLKLTSKSSVATDTIKMRFAVGNLMDLTGQPSLNSFDFLPGQFVSLQFGEKSWRAYSIASLPTQDTLELIVRLVEGGVASESFRAAKIGDTYKFKGPFGHFVLSQNPEAELIFCATGTGIAPFRGMIQHEAAQKKPRKMTLLYGGRDTQDLAYLEEIADWAHGLSIKLALSRQEGNIALPIGVEDQFTWEKCRITKFLKEEDFPPNTEVYICGNGDMVVDTQNILLEKGLPKDHLFMERFN